MGLADTMKVCAIIFGVLLAAAAVFAQQAIEQNPLFTALQPQLDTREIVFVEPDQGGRQKRSLLLGAGAGLLGAGAVGAGVLGAGLLGASVIGAKAGFVGGALASGALSHGRSYGGYGGYYSGGYGGYGSYGGYGGYGGYGRSYGGYRSYYPSSYVVSSWW